MKKPAVLAAINGDDRQRLLTSWQSAVRVVGEVDKLRSPRAFAASHPWQSLRL